MRTSLYFILIAFVTLASYQHALGQGARGPIQGGQKWVNSYCAPSLSSGTQFGDFIDDVILTDISNLSNGHDTANNGYTDNSFEGAGLITRLRANNTYTISIRNGTWPTDDIAAWIDYNGNKFFEPNELLGTATTSAAAELTDFLFTVPFGATPGYHGLRVMCAFDALPNPDPCGFNVDFGEYEDYVVLIEHSAQCIPLFTFGNTDGDFITSLSLAGYTDNSFSPFSDPYRLPFDGIRLDAATSYNIDFVGGDHDDDNFSVWVDWNRDGDFDDADEDIGDHQVTTTLEQFAIPIVTPAALAGWFDMRVVCADITTPVYCPDASYGESRDYKLIIDSPDFPCYTYNYFGNTTASGGAHVTDISVNGNSLSLLGTRPNHFVRSTNDPTHVFPGDQLNLTLIAGNVLSDVYAIYYDADGDLSYSPSELLTTNFTNIVGETITQFVPIPNTSSFGIHFLRVGLYGAQNVVNDPCQDPFEGLVFDIPIFVDDPNGPCTPAFNNWTRFGDFIDGVELNTLSNLNSGGVNGVHYTSYDAAMHTTDVTTGLTYDIDITAGDYFDNEFYIWVDHNEDDDFDDGGEFIGQIGNTSGGQIVTIPYTVPTGIALGQKTMRVMCSTSMNANPCTDAFAGETEDYNITITSSTSVQDEFAEHISTYMSGFDLIIRSAPMQLGASYHIVDGRGRVVGTGAIQQERQTHDLQGQPAGVYTLMINDAQHDLYRSFVITR